MSARCSTKENPTSHRAMPALHVFAVLYGQPKCRNPFSLHGLGPFCTHKSKFTLHQPSNPLQMSFPDYKLHDHAKRKGIPFRTAEHTGLQPTVSSGEPLDFPPPQGLHLPLQCESARGLLLRLQVHGSPNPSFFPADS